MTKHAERLTHHELEAIVKSIEQKIDLIKVYQNTQPGDTDTIIKALKNYDIDSTKSNAWSTLKNYIENYTGKGGIRNLFVEISNLEHYFRNNKKTNNNKEEYERNKENMTKYVELIDKFCMEPVLNTKNKKLEKHQEELEKHQEELEKLTTEIKKLQHDAHAKTPYQKTLNLYIQLKNKIKDTINTFKNKDPNKDNIQQNPIDKSLMKIKALKTLINDDDRMINFYKDAIKKQEQERENLLSKLKNISQTTDYNSETHNDDHENNNNVEIYDNIT